MVMLGVERRRMNGSGRFSVGIVVFGPKNVPDTNGGCLSHILPSLTHKDCLLGPKSNIGCQEAVERVLNEPPFVPDTFNYPAVLSLFTSWVAFEYDLHPVRAANLFCSAAGSRRERADCPAAWAGRPRTCKYCLCQRHRKLVSRRPHGRH